MPQLPPPWRVVRAQSVATGSGDRVLRPRNVMGTWRGWGATLSTVLALMGCASSPSDGPALRTSPEPAGLTGQAEALAESGGAYSAAQAERGREVFVDVCRECHASSEFRGREFEFTWRRRTAWDLYRELRRTMPEDFPGGLAPQAYVDVIAYVLEINDYPLGGGELLPTEESLRRVPLGPGANKGS